MKSVHLQINESIYNKVMYFLSHLPKKDIYIENNEELKTKKKFNSLSLKTKNFKFDRNEANAR